MMKNVKISKHEAIIVLHYFGEEGYYRPGGFEEKLLSALCHADVNNQDKIGLGFPGLTAAVQIAQSDTNGLRTLKGIAGRNVI